MTAEQPGSDALVSPNRAQLRPEELLSRLAETLKADIAPAVADDYTRTQAHMASVILQRVAKQVRLAPRHADATAIELAELVHDLEATLATSPMPDPVVEAWQDVIAEPSIDGLGPLLRALHRWDHEVATAALDRIRMVLRADIDRRMEIAS